MKCFTVWGGMAHPVEIKVDLLARLPAVVIAGLPAHSVRETAERVRSALTASGFEWPKKRVVVEVSSPVPIQGTGLDLAIALAVLEAAGVKIPYNFAALAPWAELSLSGVLRPVRGGLAVERASKEEGFRWPVFAEGQPQGTWAAYHAHDLRSLLDGLPLVCGKLAKPANVLPSLQAGFGLPDLTPVLERAVAVKGVVMLRGKPGCGATMVASRIPQSLPLMTEREALEAAQVADAAGLLQEPSLTRPFRAPHHTISLAGMMGGNGGTMGEYALAHKGVLFLDEVDQMPLHLLKEVAHWMKQEVRPLHWIGGKVDTLWKPARIVLACNRTDHVRLAERQAEIIALFGATVIEM